MWAQLYIQPRVIKYNKSVCLYVIQMTWVFKNNYNSVPLFILNEGMAVMRQVELAIKTSGCSKWISWLTLKTWFCMLRSVQVSVVFALKQGKCWKSQKLCWSFHLMLKRQLAFHFKFWSIILKKAHLSASVKMLQWINPDFVHGSLLCCCCCCVLLCYGHIPPMPQLGLMHKM